MIECTIGLNCGKAISASHNIRSFKPGERMSLASSLTFPRVLLLLTLTVFFCTEFAAALTIGLSAPFWGVAPNSNAHENRSRLAPRGVHAENQQPAELVSNRSPRTLLAAFTLRSDTCDTNWEKLGSKCYRYLTGSWTQEEAAQQCRAADSLGVATLATASSDAEYTNIRTAISMTGTQTWAGARFESETQGE